jgi:endonuclease/exonuclease/phosphatase family metal-dependent hydrolase
LLIRILSASFGSFFCAATALAGASTLHIMSYNIKGLPTPILSSDYKDERYPLIGKLLAKRGSEGKAPEVVVLQEAFSDPSTKLIEAAAVAYPFTAEGPQARSILGVNSGLYILSKHKILKRATRAFGGEHCLSWDCFSNKGVQMATVEVPGLPRPLEIYNTHLQAGREDTAVRQAQVKILLEFFEKEHVPGNPVVFAGDFNFRPGLKQKSYFDFAEGTKFQHAGKICLERGCAKGTDNGWHGIWERAVDHQFFSATGPVKITPVYVERTYREPVDGLVLSDHPAHEVRYDLQWDVKTLASEPARSGTSVP